MELRGRTGGNGMAYFQDRQKQEEEYQPVFQEPPGMYDPDDYADDVDDPEYYDDDEYMTEEDKQWQRQGKWRVLAGLGDFLGVIAGTVAILVLVALLISLVHWVQADIRQSFTLWQTKM